MKFLNSAYILLFILMSSCGRVWHKADFEYTRYEIGSEKTSLNHPMNDLIGEYKSQLDQEMNEVIGTCEDPLTKEWLESSLGYWLADILLEEASRLTTKNIDFALQNYGGMRIPYLSKGDIKVETIYELMPFDNMLVIMEANGEVTKKLLDRIADDGGWPVSHTLSFEIQDKKAVNIKINGKAFDYAKKYRFALPDYIANGGGDCTFLEDLEKEDYGLLVRDAIINHIKRDTEAGINQSGKKEGRIKRK